ncbi:hypothetical protein VTN49DRAFT_4081 [Thermomyces lanuginosus]|uniref:uncharacterized protein n=1 Tax=Thermomyces lanuginosus TaxID=5541 RepID=UPI0037445E0D
MCHISFDVNSKGSAVSMAGVEMCLDRFNLIEQVEDKTDSSGFKHHLDFMNFRIYCSSLLRTRDLGSGTMNL